MTLFNRLNYLRKRLLIVAFLFVVFSDALYSQSVIEVTEPYDADIILLSVNKKEDADIVVYKTNKISESKKWDCMWLFKKWGFSELSVFIYTNLADTTEFIDEDLKYRINGKVYFTDNINERGYKDPNIKIEGLVRKYNEYHPENLFANIGNDSISNLKKDSVLESNNLNQVVLNQDTNTLHQSGNSVIVFKVQVGACHRQIPEEELHKRYPGNKSISEEMNDGWYKYLIGNYNNYSEAKSEKQSCGTPDAWVVVYKDDKRVNIKEVINILSYYTISTLFIVMIS